MSRIEELKDRIDSKTLNFVLLTMASLGMYALIWMYRSNQIISEVTQRRIVDLNYFIWITVCIGWSGAFGATEEPSLLLISAAFSIAYGVLSILWAFKARAALVEYALSEHRIYLRMNSFYTFLFQAFYINYCINDLPEEKRRQELFRGDAPSAPGSSHL